MLTHQRTQSAHYPALDALRGVAAFGVVLSHVGAFYKSAFPNASGFQAIVVSLDRLGHPAVVLFFVLSGFVLTLAYAGKAKFSYVDFIGRRIFRIHPAFWACFAIAVMLAISIDPLPNPARGTYWNNAIPEPQSLGGMLAMATLLVRGDAYSVLPVTWSLVHEMRFSLVFPAMLLLVIRVPRLCAVSISIALLGLSGLMTFRMGHLFLGKSEIYSWIFTALYLPVFAAGMLLALKKASVLKLRLGDRSERIMAAGAALSLLADIEIVSVAASLVLIAVCIRPSRFASFLSGPLLSWFGRISFSLYLIHFPILFYAAYYASKAMLLPFLVGGVVVSLMAATALNRLVEQPFHALGKKVFAHRAKPLSRQTDDGCTLDGAGAADGIKGGG